MPEMEANEALVIDLRRQLAAVRAELARMTEEWRAACQARAEAEAAWEDDRAELAEAQAEKHQSALDAAQVTSELIEKLRATRAELAEARKDTERLDWWIEHPELCLVCGGNNTWAAFRWSDRQTDWCESKRAAIDATYKREEPKCQSKS